MDVDPSAGDPDAALDETGSVRSEDDGPQGPAPRRRWWPRRRTRTAPARPTRWWELPALLVVAIGIAILLKTFVVQPFYIPSGSMQKTLYGCPGCSGDRILVNKLIYDFRDPHPGDIVVFHDPPGWEPEGPTSAPSNPVERVARDFGQFVGFVPPDGEDLVKRVIAVGGQTVKGDAQGNVYISNTGPQGPYRELDEPFVWVDKVHGGQLPFGPVTVPDGRLWVMGDHRNYSADSRFHCHPGQETDTDDQNCDPVASTVPVSDVIGKAVVIAWPPSRWRTLGTPSTFTSAASAAGSYFPPAAGLLVVTPVYALRRRRRRR